MNVLKLLAKGVLNKLITLQFVFVLSFNISVYMQYILYTIMYLCLKQNCKAHDSYIPKNISLAEVLRFVRKCFIFN